MYQTGIAVFLLAAYVVVLVIAYIVLRRSRSVYEEDREVFGVASSENSREIRELRQSIAEQNSRINALHYTIRDNERTLRVLGKIDALSGELRSCATRPSYDCYDMPSNKWDVIDLLICLASGAVDAENDGCDCVEELIEYCDHEIMVWHSESEPQLTLDQLVKNSAYLFTDKE